MNTRTPRHWAGTRRARKTRTVLAGLLLISAMHVGSLRDHHNTQRAVISGPLISVPRPAPSQSAQPARATRSMQRKRPATFNRVRQMQVTAYCATGNRTASGAWPQVGMAAALDRSIKFGTKLIVPGFGVVTVTDRIGHSSDLDLFMGSGAACRAKALTWGRRHLTVKEQRP